MKAKNPIMSGFYPDPSICAVGEDYYLVNSSFTYFPGLPIMHSKDLCHWEQIGNVMDRDSQLNCLDAEISRGLFAPTIRYHEGVYYVICTNVSGKGNYIVTATDPAGPWSEPYYIEGAGGIDPSLFFDDDGKAYYIGTHENPEGAKYNGDWYIWIQEIDLKEMKLVGEHKDVWNGAMKNIIWPEGPHLYKKDGYYYIMHAEGGTGPHHAITVCRSKNIWGPYENNFCNPIFTHRHMGKAYPIQYVGHADMIETPNGDWYMVMLAVRPAGGYTTMGRETFLAKVIWEEGWPVVNPGVGLLEEEVEVNLPEWHPETEVPGDVQEYDFAAMDKLGYEFLFIRSEAGNQTSFVPGKGLSMKYGTENLIVEKSPSYLGIRQRHHQFTLTTEIAYDGIKEGQKSGIVYFQNSNYHLRLEVEGLADGKTIAKAVLTQDGKEEVTGETKELGRLSSKAITAKIDITGLYAAVSIIVDGTETVLAKDIMISALSTEVAGGFVGCTMGPYAVWENAEGEDHILLTKLSYVGGTK